jgi:hypothetical protein
VPHLEAKADRLKAGGLNPVMDSQMLDFDGLNAIIGTADLIAHGKRYE